LLGGSSIAVFLGCYSFAIVAGGQLSLRCARFDRHIHLLCGLTCLLEHHSPPPGSLHLQTPWELNEPGPRMIACTLRMSCS
jgi:hypothetical protein